MDFIDIAYYLPNDKLYLIIYGDHGTMVHPMSSFYRIAQWMASNYLDVHLNEIQETLDKLMQGSNARSFDGGNLAVTFYPPSREELKKHVLYWNDILMVDPSYDIEFYPNEDQILEVLRNLVDVPRGQTVMYVKHGDHGNFYFADEYIPEIDSLEHLDIQNEIIYNDDSDTYYYFENRKKASDWLDNFT